MGGVLHKRLLLNVSQYSQEHLSWSLFLLKLQEQTPSNTGVSYEYCIILKNAYFEEHMWSAASETCYFLFPFCYLQERASLVYEYITFHEYCIILKNVCFEEHMWFAVSETCYFLFLFCCLQEHASLVYEYITFYNVQHVKIGKNCSICLQV